ncbi:hypothetical protein GCM10010221_29090 [Streptomyces parvus]|nr:hypothetical protein GCM10010221_29090 [Streptomyces parvus]
MSIIGPLKPAVRRETFRAGLALHKPRDAQRSTNQSGIDGATLYPLLATTEMWPDPWIQPWGPRAPEQAEATRAP